jgi:uncharacterized protein YcfJ
MSSFERDLMDDHGIPFKEAADFYLGFKKVAFTPNITSEEAADASKKGMLSGVTQASKDTVVDMENRGERAGRAVGHALGTVGGAVAGHKLLKGPAGALVGGALGYAAGGSAGKEVGRGRDIARHLKHAAVRMRFKLAYMKLAEEPMAEMGGAMSSPTAGQELQPANYLDAEMLGQKAQSSQEGVFYRQRAQQAEQMAQAAQAQMEQLQQQMQQVQAQVDQTGQQVQASMQEAMAARDDALHQTQLAANMRMGMQKLRQQMLEVASQDPSAVAAAELQGAADAQMQEQVAAAQGEDAALEGDPEGVGAPSTPPAKTQKEVEEASRAQDEAGKQTQQAELAAGAPKPQGSPAEGAAPGPSGGADLQSMMPAGGMKVGQVPPELAKKLPFILGGAGLGAVAGAGVGALRNQQMQGRAEGLRGRVRAMEAQESGGFRHALQLAAEKGRLAATEAREAHPGASMAYDAGLGALGGATIGASAGPAAGRLIRQAVGT